MQRFSSNLQSSVSQRLLNIWKTRYTTKVQHVSQNSDDFRKYPLEFVASQAGRNRTLEKLSDKFIKNASHWAAVKTKSLYLQHEYLRFNETVDLSKFTLQTIPILLKYYQEQAPLVVQPAKDTPEASAELEFGITEISTLADHLGKYFTEFESQYSTSKDWLARCFLTSQISLTSVSLLAALDPVERAMFNPYCNLLEEYVSIPWWQLCLAAGQYNQVSRQYKLVERILPHTSEISLRAYNRWSQTFDTYASTRGKLTDLKIRRSSLRDFDMFQIYLWVSLLQGNLDVIEKELIVFCVYIFKGLDIPWQMTVAGIRLLLEAILMQLTPDEKAIANDFINGMMNAFQSAD